MHLNHIGISIIFMKKKMIDFRVLIPNLVTLVAICAGLSAIRFAFEGNFHWAMIAIVVSAILDGLDGRIARALRVTSQFGAELDSLADVINFGVVPALILYIWDLNRLGDLGWLACLLYVIAVVLRLARFNVMDFKSPDLCVSTSEVDNSLEEPTVTPRAYFIGVPAPIAAILVLLPIYLSLSGGKMLQVFSPIEPLYVIMIAGFTISTLKTYSLKAVRFNAKNSLFVMFGIALLAALLFSFTWTGLVILCTCYVCYLLYKSLKIGIKRVVAMWFQKQDMG